tara:strand:- start:68 stop:2200 length:2133 start_codon:yes stop_codon:yes gene_type:complete
MAEKKVIEIDIESNLGSLKSQLREAQTEVASLSDKFGATSKEAAEAAKRAAELKDRIGDAKALTDAFNPDAKFNALSSSIGGVLNGFQAYEGALGLIGVENEDLQKTLLKVQSAMALSQGIQGLAEAKDSFVQLGAVVKNTTLFTSAYNFVMGISNKETATNVLVTEADTSAKVGLTGATGVLSTVTGGATTAMKLFRVALIATGIGAIIVLIGLLIANFDKVTAVVQKLSGYVIKAYDYFDNLGTSIKILIGIFFPMIGVVYGAIKALEYFNVIDTKNERDMSARHVANIKRIDKELAKREEAKKARKKAYDEETGNIDRQIKLLEAQGKSTEALEKLQLKRSLTNQRELIKEARLNLQILRATNIGGVNDQMIEETLTAIAQMKQGILNTETDIKIARINNAKETKEKIKESDKELDLTKDELYQLEQKRLAELNKAELDSLNVIDAAKKANADMLLTEQELAIQKENEAYQIKLDNAIKFGQDTEALEIEHLNNLNNINRTEQEKQYANDKEAKEKQIALDKETAEKKLEIEKLLNEQKATIQQQGLDTALQGVGIIKSVFEKSKGVQKAAVIAESAIGIAKMIISNKLANIGALATPQAIATSGASAVPVIAANNISTGFGIAANVAATAKALSALGGGGAPSGSVGNDGGGGGGGGFNPSFNVVGNSGINQLAGIQQQPVKAYITTGEVSTALSLERNTLQKTTF